MNRSTKLARNFVKARGVAQLRYLIDAFERNESGQVIAEHLGVTRERVRQWRDAFGMTVSFYQPGAEVRSMLRSTT